MDKKKIEKLRARNEKRLQKKESLKQKRAIKKQEQEKQGISRQKLFSQKYIDKKTKWLTKKKEALEKRFSQEIKVLETKLKKISAKQTTEAINKKKNSLLYKYLVWKMNMAKKKFTNKEKTINFKMEILKIDHAGGKEKLEKLKIDRENILDLYQKKLKNIEDSIKARRLETKIDNLKQIQNKAIVALEKRKNSTPPSNWIDVFKDKWETFKTMYVRKIQISDIFSKISAHIRKYSMFYVLLFIIATFAIATKGVNLKSNIFITILNSNTYMLIIGMGMLLVIVSGNIDLSVGSLMGFAGALSVIIYNATGYNLLLTIVLTCLFGMVVGIFQGILIGYFKIPSFIVTLAVMLLFQGLILTITKSKTLLPSADIYGNSSYIEYITGSVFQNVNEPTFGNFKLYSFLVIFGLGLLAMIGMVRGRVKKQKYGILTDSTFAFVIKLGFLIALFGVVSYWVGTSLFGLKYYILYIIALLVMFIFITKNTAFGRKIYAVGGNKKAAQLSGINVARTITLVFMITGILTSFASVIFTGIATNASPTVSSAGYELDVISSVFVGGASMTGGIGSIAGSFIGALVLGYINNGMALLNFKADLQKIVKSIVLILAVGYDVYSNRKIG